jgi:hypothetical protein
MCDDVPRPSAGGWPGVSCFLLARWRPDGTGVNRCMVIRGSKGKMRQLSRTRRCEDQSCAARSAGCSAEPGHGVRTIIEMVADGLGCDCNGLASAAGQRAGRRDRALHHMLSCARRSAPNLLNRQPLIARTVLADLVLESEGVGGR